MSSLWFVVPAHGRVEKTHACLRQLARTCDELEHAGLAATAVVVAADENLETARELGFAAVNRPNSPLGRKWNDGCEYAGRAGADFFCWFGSDDWIDPILFLDQLPDQHEVRCSRLSAVVSEDGSRIAPLRIWYDGGDGVKILPRALLAPYGFRPAENNRDRAIDSSIMRRLSRNGPPSLVYFDAHPFQIVDWKTPGSQLNTYAACLSYANGPQTDPWDTLAGRYPDEALDEMRAVYGLPVRVAA